MIKQVVWTVSPVKICCFSFVLLPLILHMTHKTYIRQPVIAEISRALWGHLLAWRPQATGLFAHCLGHIP